MPELRSLTGSSAEAQRQDPTPGGHFHYDTLKSLGRITEGLAEGSQGDCGSLGTMKVEWLLLSMGKEAW